MPRAACRAQRQLVRRACARPGLFWAKWVPGSAPGNCHLFWYCPGGSGAASPWVSTPHYTAQDVL
jgi:hypothetical protein